MKELYKLHAKHKNWQAVAEDLGITPQHLSRILNGHQQPSKKLADRIARKAVTEENVLWDMTHPIYRQAVIDIRDSLDRLLAPESLEARE